MSGIPQLNLDLAVIGRGLESMAAVLFAHNRGLSVGHIGTFGKLSFCTGLLDLINPDALANSPDRETPWETISRLLIKYPKHPYGKLSQAGICAAFDELLEFLSSAGLPYFYKPQQNCRVITPLGTLKQTYAIPDSMKEGTLAWEQKKPCLLADLQGLREFSATQIVQGLSKSWPGLRSTRASLPGSGRESQILSGEVIAKKLEEADILEHLAEQIKPHIIDAQAVGLPAVLGTYKHNETMHTLKELLGAPVFEIPTMPVSVPGARLVSSFGRGMEPFGLKRLYCYSVTGHDFALPDGNIKLELESSQDRLNVHSKGVILAAGRFLTGGLIGGRHGVSEPVFDLPLHQPDERDQWYGLDFFDPAGHGINLAGVETDHNLQPLDRDGNPACPGLYAVGSILAHQDMHRLGCEAGVAVGSAYKAVELFSAKLQNRTTSHTGTYSAGLEEMENGRGQAA